MISLRDYVVITIIMAVIVFMFQFVNIMGVVDRISVPYTIIHEHGLVRPVDVLK